MWGVTSAFAATAVADSPHRGTTFRTWHINPQYLDYRQQRWYSSARTILFVSIKTSELVSAKELARMLIRKSIESAHCFSYEAVKRWTVSHVQSCSVQLMRNQRTSETEDELSCCFLCCMIFHFQHEIAYAADCNDFPYTRACICCTELIGNASFLTPISRNLAFDPRAISLGYMISIQKALVKHLRSISSLHRCEWFNLNKSDKMYKHRVGGKKQMLSTLIFF